jgi:hypothetical protein
MSWDISVGTATGYELDGSEIGIRHPARARDPSFLHNVQTGFESHPVPYVMGIGNSFLGCKAAVFEADHSPPSNVEVKNGEATPVLSHTPS